MPRMNGVKNGIARQTADNMHRLDGVPTDVHSHIDDDTVLAEVMHLSIHENKMKIKTDQEELFAICERMTKDANYAFEVASQ
jgi:hypothetical protein